MQTNYLPNLFLALDEDPPIECHHTYRRMAYPASDLLQSMCKFFISITPLFVFHASASVNGPIRNFGFWSHLYLIFTPKLHSQAPLPGPCHR